MLRSTILSWQHSMTNLRAVPNPSTTKRPTHHHHTSQSPYINDQLEDKGFYRKKYLKEDISAIKE
jgi:hypothetical protein